MLINDNHLKQTRLLKTEPDVFKLGPSSKEICFLGRSNVGKSSLINAICQRKNLAHVSQMPGKTRTINVYEVYSARWLVDLPGYGFAVGGEKAKDELGLIIESYLKDRQSLQMIYLVLDAIAAPTKLDQMMINWLKHYQYPFTYIVNKIDKIAFPKLEERKQEIIKSLNAESATIIWLSTSKKIGLSDLSQHILKSLNS